MKLRSRLRFNAMESPNAPSATQRFRRRDTYSLLSVYIYHADYEIGVLGAIRPISSLFAGPLICAFANKHGIEQKVRLLFEHPRPECGIGIALISVQNPSR